MYITINYVNTPIFGKNSIKTSINFIFYLPVKCNISSIIKWHSSLRTIVRDTRLWHVLAIKTNANESCSMFFITQKPKNGNQTTLKTLLKIAVNLRKLYAFSSKKISRAFFARLFRHLGLFKMSRLAN